jgi:predicted deacylase
MSDNNYAIELEPPDISGYKDGGSGIDYVHTFDSGVDGPHVCINALMHGNEICGAIALDLLLKAGLRPVRGKLTLCFVNAGAFLTFDPENPNASRFVDEDCNRVWVEERLHGSESSAELERARALLPLYDVVDHVLDIHSMGTLSEPIMLCNGLAKEREMVAAMGVPRIVGCGSGHIVGKRLIEYTPFNDVNTHKTGLLIECGQHWEQNAANVAMDASLFYLKAHGMLPEGFLEKHVVVPNPPEQWSLEITVGYTTNTDEFQFVEPFVGMEQFAQAGTLIATDGADEIRTPYDNCVLVMPNHRAGKNVRALRFAHPTSA